MPSKEPRTPIRGLQAFHYPSYRWFWLTSVMTFASVHMQQLVRGFLAQELTPSPFLVTLSFGLWSLPLLILPLIGGTLADRVDRRVMLVASEAVNSVLVIIAAVVTAFGGMTIGLLMAFSLLGGAVTGATLPVRQAMIGDLVPRPVATNAVVHFTLVLNGMMAIAPGVAGFTIEAGGAHVALFVAFGLAVLGMLTATKLPSWRPIADTATSAKESFFEGVRFIRGSHSLTAVISSAALFTVFATGYMALLPVFQRDVLEVGGSELGLLFTAAGIGGLIAAVLLAALNVSRPMPGVMIGAGIAQGLILIAFSQSEWLALSVAIMVGAGMTQSIFLAINMAMVQQLAPSEIAGRVFAFRAVIWGIAPVGHLMLGGLAEVIGPKAGLAAIGMVSAVVQLGVWIRIRAKPLQIALDEVPEPQDS